MSVYGRGGGGGSWAGEAFSKEGLLLDFSITAFLHYTQCYSSPRQSSVKQFVHIFYSVWDSVQSGYSTAIYEP